MSSLFDFAVITIFARETLEGGIIIGEYRTIILRSDWSKSEISQDEALLTVTTTALAAGFVALVICAAIAIPLAVLSRDFEPKTAILIEGVSKIVAAVCLLQLSLKMPKFFGLYHSRSKSNNKNNKKDGDNEVVLDRNSTGESDEDIASSDDDTPSNTLTLRSMRFNVAWNIWREVAECGVFLIPFFLTGEDIMTIPLSAVVGFVSGASICLAIYYANRKFKSTVGLTIFTSSLLMFLSTGLFSGGCHKFEMVYGLTPIVWQLEGDFWDVERLPMTVFKPFGYSDVRTLLQILCFWLWLMFGCGMHYRKYRSCFKSKDDEVATTDEYSSGDEENGVEDKTGS